MIKNKFILLLLLIVILISGCITQNNTKDNEKLPNPASVYCEEQGGTLEIRTNPDGSQTGYCIFPDGSECEEWIYFCSCTNDKKYCGKEYAMCHKCK